MQKKVLLEELKAIFHLALPLILNLLAFMGMQLVDTVMLGKLGPLALAAAALGNVVYIVVIVGSFGILTAVGTLAAQAFGEKAVRQVAFITQQGLWIAMCLTIPGSFFLWNAHHFLLWIKQPAQVVLGTKDFLHGLVFGYFAILTHATLKEFVTAIAKPKVIFIISASAIPFNALLNYIFMYGKWGFPAMHIFGVGLATSVVNWIMLIAITVYIKQNRDIQPYPIFHWVRPKLTWIKKLIRLGVPVGVSFTVEELLFVITALLMGYFGVNALAAHQITIQCLYTAVMIPLGIAQATAVRVSQLLGVGDRQKALTSAYLSITSAFLLAIIAACSFWFLPQTIIHFFLDTRLPSNLPVVALAVKLLAITAIFHLVDAVQIVTNGALRGHQDTLVPMFLGLLSFWLLGVGSGYWLGFIRQEGPVGLWWGLALGIMASAILLQLRLVSHKRLLAVNTEIT